MFPQSEDACLTVYCFMLKDYVQAQRIRHSSALIIGALDRFAEGNPHALLETLNSHVLSSEVNQIVCLEKTGHSFLKKEQELADTVASVVSKWDYPQ